MLQLRKQSKNAKLDAAVQSPDTKDPIPRTNITASNKRKRHWSVSGQTEDSDTQSLEEAHDGGEYTTDLSEQSSDIEHSTKRSRTRRESEIAESSAHPSACASSSKLTSKSTPKSESGFPTESSASNPFSHSNSLAETTHDREDTTKPMDPLTIPDDVFLEILGHLSSPADFAAIVRVCRRFQSLGRKQLLRELIWVKERATWGNLEWWGRIVRDTRNGEDADEGEREVNALMLPRKVTVGVRFDFGTGYYGTNVRILSSFIFISHAFMTAFWLLVY